MEETPTSDDELQAPHWLARFQDGSEVPLPVESFFYIRCSTFGVDVPVSDLYIVVK